LPRNHEEATPLPVSDRDQFAILDVADRFFLMCYSHDVDIIKPRLHQRGIDLGVASALLAEGIICRGIDIREGYVVPLNPQASTDRLGQIIMQDLVRSEPHDVRTWIEYLGQTSWRMVSNRLQAKGVLVRQSKRGLLPGIGKVRYQAVAPESALVLESLVLDLLSGEFPAHSTPTLADIVVALLAQATGLVASLLWDDRPRVGRAQLERLSQSLPYPLLHLVRRTEAAVAGAAIHHRR
jgi:Golgi phosphoprotein 3 (GPP34)